MAENEQCSQSGCSSESCEGCDRAAKGSLLQEANIFSQVKKVIGIVSGKGGVGKSMVTASLAVQMAGKGYRVGILDADITGPSIPKMFGLTGPAEGDDHGLFPSETDSGIRVMSINLLMEDREAPVIWRGPVIANMVKQFWSDVMWGELDYLFVDMPPGTGDVPLTVFQSLPIDGTVLVTSPQELVKMIVKKAYNMAKTMNIPMLGIVENYSYLECPDCGKKISVFGTSKIEEVSEEMGLLVFGKIPVLPAMAEIADAGNFDAYNNPYLEPGIALLEKMLEQ